MARWPVALSWLLGLLATAIFAPVIFSSGEPQPPLPQSSTGLDLSFVATQTGNPTPGVTAVRPRPIETSLPSAATPTRAQAEPTALSPAGQHSAGSRSKVASALAAVRSAASRIRVQIEATGPDLSGIRTTVAAAGGVMVRSYSSLAIAEMPRAALDALASRPDVVFVQEPVRPVPDTVQGQEVAASGAASWHSASIDGTGVKVAVIDSSFAGYQERMAGGELPSTLQVRDFTGGHYLQGAGHGTAAAEVIHEMAPNATLYLLAVEDLVGLGLAKDYCLTNGISIVSHSMTWFNTSRGDGSGGPGTPDSIVAHARENGILWVNSAGNYARNHWAGGFADTNKNGWHEFVAGDAASEMNTFTLPAGGSASIYMKWDAWPVTLQNLDLYIYDPLTGAPVASSKTIQDNTPPVEVIHYTNNTPFPQSYHLCIQRVVGSGSPRLDLFVLGVEPTYVSPAGSIAEPASSSSVLAVGAVNWQTNALDPNSSQGPTVDSRLKPDLSGPSGLASATFPGGFAGTSAGAASVAGAAALVKQRYPSYSPALTQAYLETAALELGDNGKDNLYGSGVLRLPSPVTTHSIDLHAGWNWFSISVRPADTSIPAVLASIAGKYDYLLGETGTYAPLPSAQALNSIESIEPGKGYMLRMKQAATLAVTGVDVSPATPLELTAGWHWIGYLGTAGRGPAEALVSVNGEYDWLLGEEGTYSPPPSPAFLNNLNRMEVGKGYLIRMRQPGAIIYEP